MACLNPLRCTAIAFYRGCNEDSEHFEDKIRGHQQPPSLGSNSFHSGELAIPDLYDYARKHGAIERVLLGKRGSRCRRRRRIKDVHVFHRGSLLRGVE